MRHRERQQPQARVSTKSSSEHRAQPRIDCAEEIPKRARDVITDPSGFEDLLIQKDDDGRKQIEQESEPKPLETFPKPFGF
jgi:hypothetical protein